MLPSTSGRAATTTAGAATTTAGAATTTAGATTAATMSMVYREIGGGPVPGHSGKVAQNDDAIPSSILQTKVFCLAWEPPEGLQVVAPHAPQPSAGAYLSLPSAAPEPAIGGS